MFEITCLAPSMIFMGNMPRVKLSTSLSVTSDLRLRGLGFLPGWGTWGRYFQRSSLIYNGSNQLSKNYKFTKMIRT